MKRFALTLCALAFFNIAVAADAPEYGPIPDWVKPEEIPTTAAVPDGAPLKLLLSDQQLNFLPPSQETFEEDVVRIQAAQGLQALSTLQLPWKPDTDLLTIHKVHIIRGDQIIDALANGQKFTLLRRENNLEYSALDGVLTAVFQPADLRVGDIIDMAYSIKRTDPIMAGAAEQIAGGWIQAPYDRVHLRARWPQPNPIRWRLTDDLQGLEVHEDGGFAVLEYTAKNIKPPVQPKGAPLRFAVTREIEFSSFKSWPEVSRRLAPLFAKAATLAPDSPLKAEAAHMRATAHTPLELASGALRLVEDDVRYVFLGMNQGGIVPAPADLTWSRRFGDCKAKTVLLIALLRELGIDAEPVAVSTRIGDGLDGRLPMVGLFDHVIVRAHIGGQVYWLDGTRSSDRHVHLLQMPNYHWGLPLLPAGSELIRIESAPLTTPARDTHIRIDATAGITMPAPMHVETVMSGDDAIAVRLSLAPLTGDALERAMRDYWSKAYDFVDIKSVSARFDENAMTETLTMDGSAHMSWKDQWYETDGLGVGFEAQFTRDAGANMQAPYAVNYPHYGRTTETILLPVSATPFTTSGNAVDRVVAGVEYKRSFSLTGGTFTAEASARSVQQEFPATEAADAQIALRAMIKDDLYLRSPDPPPSPAQQYVDQGVKLLDGGTYDSAIAAFDAALAIEPRQGYALANRGLAYLWKGDSDKALKDWDAAEAIDPNNPVVPRGRGVLAYRAGKFADAIADFTQSLQRMPDNTFTLSWRASAYEITNRPTEAIADSAAVLATSPNDINMRRIHGESLARKEQIDAAMSDAHALIANVGTPPAYQAAATIYQFAGKSDEALQAINHAIKTGPTVEAYLQRVELRPPSDQVGRMQDIDAALRLDPRNMQAIVMKASTQQRNGQFADAAATATAAIAVDGAKFPYLLLRLSAEVKIGQMAAVDQDVKQARMVATSTQELNNLCWYLATANVALTDALGACDDALARTPGDAATLDSKGFALLRLGRYQESIAAYDAALAARGVHAPSLYGRGLAKRRAGDTQGGSRDIAAALALDRTIASLFSTFGVQAEGGASGPGNPAGAHVQ